MDRLLIPQFTQKSIDKNQLYVTVNGKPIPYNPVPSGITYLDSVYEQPYKLLPGKRKLEISK